VERLVNQGGGDVPFTRSGSSGDFGWLFLVANNYSWTITLDITATDSNVTGTASAKGRFSPWYSFSFTDREASSKATGNVRCERIKGECQADASGGQDQDTDVDYTSAVIVNGSESGSKASLDVEVAAAIAGQVAISSITVGVEASGVKVGATINLPTSANDSKKLSRSYAYRCSEIEIL
jgi:phage tail sheath gpL-like